MARTEEALWKKKDGLLHDWAISSVGRRKAGLAKSRPNTGLPGQIQRKRRVFFFFSKIPKQIFKWILNFSTVFESNHSIQKSNAAA
jgi:hypothetical protein